MKFKGSIPCGSVVPFAMFLQKLVIGHAAFPLGNNEHGYQNGILEFACQLGKLTSNVVGEPASQSEPAVPLLARILSWKIQTKSKPQLQCILSRKIQTKSQPQIQRIFSQKIQTKSQQQIQLSVRILMQLKSCFQKDISANFIDQWHSHILKM